METVQMMEHLEWLNVDSVVLDEIVTAQQNADKCFGAADDLKIAYAALESMGFSDNWLNIYNQDNLLFNVIGISDIDLAGKSPAAKMDVVMENMLISIGDFLVKGFVWLMNRIKMIFDWLGKYALPKENDDIFNWAVRLGEGIAQSKKTGKIMEFPLGRYKLEDIPNGVHLRQRYDLLQELINTLGSIVRGISGDKHPPLGEIASRLEDITLKHSSLDNGVKIHTGGMIIEPLRIIKGESDVADPSVGYTDLKNLQMLAKNVANTNDDIRTIQNSLRSIQTKTNAALKVAMSAKDNATRVSLEEDQAVISFLLDCAGKLVTNIIGLRTYLTRVMTELNKAADLYKEN